MNEEDEFVVKTKKLETRWSFFILLTKKHNLYTYDIMSFVINKITEK